MTSWVAVIDSSYPQHWDIAKQSGYWDMTAEHKVELGDTVYFWQGGDSLIAQCTATSSRYPIPMGSALPWADAGARAYTTRFELDCLSESPNARPSWGDLQRQWGKRYPPQFRSFDDRAAEAVLARYFDTAPIVDPYDDAERQRELERLGYDHRTYAMRSINQRQGQPAFRNDLLRAYAGACAVTGTTDTDVLEAAHIARYLGPQSHLVANGLLLRADIHTLFDLHRLTITPDYRVRVRSSLGSPYAGLDGGTIHLPSEVSDRPHEQLLLDHNAACDWL